MITDLLNSWEETYKKGQLTLWIFLSLKDGDKYVDEINSFLKTCQTRLYPVRNKVYIEV